ncbi:hypothetical protein CDCA_CDCA05G1511 [Cyanidium caldarium]|uniref:EGF-like domain-containing protein n=1 Tax=Cyanidium caldarium TaxID=2771 RepID=A0AAV9ITR8_CYACA|nr:hypothetical protein CDCA_CDCA05G1511 [Cyanidium caldarium]
MKRARTRPRRGTRKGSLVWTHPRLAFLVWITCTAAFLAVGIWTQRRTHRTRPAPHLLDTLDPLLGLEVLRDTAPLAETSHFELCQVVPGPCSGHGRCVLQTRLPTPYPPLPTPLEASSPQPPPNTVALCECDAGYAPPACDRRACPGGDLCSGNGICVGGRCACFAGWHGRACDVFRGSNDTAPSCARNPQTGVACSGGLQGVCKHNGTCACRDGWGGVACDHATAPSVYALAAQGAGTLERCPMSPPPRPSQRAVPVLPAPEPGRQWLSLSGTVLQPNASDHSIGAALPWLCIAMDAAARLGLASVAAPDLVLQQWIQLPPAAANAWYMAAAVSAPVTVNLSDALTAYMTQTLPYKLGDSVRVVNVSAGHVLPVNNSSSAEWEAVLSPHTSDDSSSNSLSALEIAGIVAIGVLALLLLIAIGVGILWRLRGRRKTTDEDSCADESPTLARNSPSAPSPHWMTAAEGVPFGGMNLEELVTVPMATPPHRTHQA